MKNLVDIERLKELFAQPHTSKNQNEINKCIGGYGDFDGDIFRDIKTKKRYYIDVHHRFVSEI